jgi:hypothetical protein
VSTARHHAEWLALIEQSRPFLSLPVLLRVFPQGLDTVDSETRRRLGQAYDEWRKSQLVHRPDPLLHREWIAFVLGEVLSLPSDCLLRDQALPAQLRLVKSEEGETLRPDLALIQPASSDGSSSHGTSALRHNDMK